MKSCPMCVRPITQIEDYPYILLNRIEFPDVGMVPGFDSDEFFKQKCKVIWAKLAPEIQKYFQKLKLLVGRKASTKELFPNWEPNRYFKKAYPLAVSSEKIAKDLIELYKSLDKKMSWSRLFKYQESLEKDSYYLSINNPWTPGTSPSNFIDGHAQVVIYSGNTAVWGGEMVHL